MNIKQLKEYIKDLPDDMEILNWNHYWGYDKIDWIYKVEVYKYSEIVSERNSWDWNWEYAEVEYLTKKQKEKVNKLNAIII